MSPKKFRAWDKKSKLFLYFDNLWEIFNEGAEMEHNGSCLFSNGDYGLFKKEDFEFSQFTGLFDKNEKEIYEGDVLQEGGLKLFEVEHSNSQFCTVPLSKEDVQKNSTGSYVVASPLWQHHRSGTGNYEFKTLLEVIGNIYEKPELKGK